MAGPALKKLRTSLDAHSQPRADQATKTDNKNITPRGLAQTARNSAGQSQVLVVMLLDIIEDSDGTFLLWATTDSGASCLMRVQDFQPYFYIALPGNLVKEDGGSEASSDDMVAVRQHFNRHLPSDSQVESVTLEHKTPIMYYRPGAKEGSYHLKLSFTRGSNLRKASGIVHKVAKTFQRWTWADRTLHEHEVSLLQRFLTDTLVSGGAWVSVAIGEQGGQRSAEPVGCPVPGLTVPWQALCCLTPDATQLADADWAPEEPAHTARHAEAHMHWTAAAASARAGDIASLRLMALDVVMATCDGQDRVPVPTKDSIVAIACIMFESREATIPPSIGGNVNAVDNGEDMDAFGSDDLGDGEAAAVDDHVASAAAAFMTNSSHDKVVFTWAKGQAIGEHRELSTGSLVKMYSSEAAMLQAWHVFFGEIDPDALPLFQVRDNLGALAERWKALKLDGGTGLKLSRAVGRRRKPLTVRKITQYSAAWVKSQARMASTSNQETFRAEIEGRLVFDILRQALTSCSLASFSLVDCIQSLLGRTLEILPSSFLAALAGISSSALVPGTSEGRMLRLARYSLARANAVCDLLNRLATIPETFELARATGLTCPQAQYNAQMIRTLSLLLRNARRLGYIVGGRQEAIPLTESPFLIHPVETGAVKLYKEPVVILDFASLYPSLFRAHNLCYTTLLHPDDVTQVPSESVTTTPTGAKFVRSKLRPGVLPSILAALISARTSTRTALKALDPGELTTRAVLDSRQKALKLVANALYGFTGAQASPLQCVPLADSCLALGAASCRRAKEILEDLAAAGRLPSCAKDAKVIYAQTDSLFAHLPHCSPAEAVQVGAEVAKLITAAFPAEMELKFENMCLPFMLLHVNRYAGRAFGSAEQLQGKGALMIKGLKSTWRQAAPIVRTTLHGALLRILMRDDLPGALVFAAEEIRRLLGGGCRLSELVMTGGLWRLTGQQVAAAAAAEGGNGAAGGTGKVEEDADVRGPHAALAVRLQKRDPGRTFVLGERLLYVLLAGARLQDEAAEDPLVAAKQGAAPDCELYWRNKLLRPLSELFAVCLSQPALQDLLNGPHTLVRVDHASTASPSSPSASRGRGRGGARQTGLSSFYKSTLKCLNCKRSIPYSGESPGPGLCSDCAALEGVCEYLHVAFIRQQQVLEARHARAWTACMQCHSGGATGSVSCTNGECDVMYGRLDAATRLEHVTTSLARLDW